MKKKLWIPFLSFFVIATAFSAAPSIDQYAFLKKVILPSISKASQIKLAIDEEILKRTDNNFSNVQLINGKNEETPFTLQLKPEGKVKKISRVQVSSTKNSDPKSLIDDNPFTTFSFDEKTDFKDASWAIIEFPELIDLHQIKIIPKSSAIIRTVEIKGGTKTNNLKKLISKRKFTRQIDLNTKPVKFIKISFWGSSIKIDDLFFLQKPAANIFFTAKPGNAYKILYGNPDLKSKRYTQVIKEDPEKIELNARLGTQKYNPAFLVDFDKDEVRNEKDNCIFHSNGKQLDTDNDGIGDPCDNARKIKNYDQSDIDYDGIGDVKDNCKATYNPAQLDSDSDGIGDKCDEINNTKNKLEGNSLGASFKIIGIIVSLLVLCGVVGFHFWKKQHS